PDRVVVDGDRTDARSRQDGLGPMRKAQAVGGGDHQRRFGGLRLGRGGHEQGPFGVGTRTMGRAAAMQSRTSRELEVNRGDRSPYRRAGTDHEIAGGSTRAQRGPPPRPVRSTVASRTPLAIADSTSAGSTRLSIN